VKPYVDQFGLLLQSNKIANYSIKSVAVLGGLFIIRQLYAIFHRKWNKYPPGPTGLPFVGSMFSAMDMPKYMSYLVITSTPQW
jgi:hypothetical protein